MTPNFKQLLTKCADELGAAPALTAEALLAAAVRRRRRTTGVRATVATLAIGAIMAAGAWLTDGDNREMAATAPSRGINPPRALTPSPAELERELVVLNSEAAWRSEVVAALAASAATTAADDDEFAAPTMSDADWLRVEAARSAALSWQYANLVEHEFRDAAAARREYERLVKRFPGTAWADLATVSLERLLTSEKTPL